MPIKGSDKKGDLHVKFNVKYPSYLSEKDKKLLASILADE
jgi:DnaJ-class molecular chaperone